MNTLIINRLLEEGLVETICATGRRLDFPDVPTFEEILGDKKPTGLPWLAYSLWIGADFVDKYLSAPPGTPDDIVAILLEAYTKMSKDPQFDQMMKQRVCEDYAIYIGQETTNLISNLVSAPPEALDYIEGLKVKAGIIAQ